MKPNHSKMKRQTTNKYLLSFQMHPEDFFRWLFNICTIRWSSNETEMQNDQTACNDSKSHRRWSVGWLSMERRVGTSRYPLAFEPPTRMKSRAPFRMLEPFEMLPRYLRIGKGLLVCPMEGLFTLRLQILCTCAPCTSAPSVHDRDE